MNRRNLTRIVALVLLLVMVGASASAASIGGVLTYVKGQGFTPKAKTDKTTAVSITYSEQFTGKDTLTWYTGAKRYTVTASGTAAKKKLRATFNGALKKYTWKLGSYTIDDTVVYGLKVSGALNNAKSLSAFRTAVKKYVTERATAKVKSYILNTNSKKFHLATCKDGNRTSAKNRRDVKCTRVSLIAMGYSPCKNCKP